ncbi:pyrroloquinoline quinone biosynthesis protein PqqC [Actinomadura darangshiensis]|uniref:Pyrroloquinoline-quinone synthase n=1 Tax=Actinomadura darangshiensis TaxID=705336 RepID=A0A4R5BF89_9ACTN|nr:pyrroloquinoline-quinone synthase PqqC [Actinomadura darangshiensis]TDD84295.1 pyrroloquinoline quinone biosynthesis protein PqqC [Actinomadura darangshiensis]
MNLEGRLRGLAAERYHHRHPFNLRMHEGLLSQEELRRWVLNRFHYQRHIPVKDAFILAKLGDRELRQNWIRRIHDHDGRPGEDGGIERWLRLGEAVGLDRTLLLSGEGVLPAVRFAVDGYVNFCRDRPRLEAVASSLTELFAPDLMATRIDAWELHYPWVEPEGLRYFQVRVSQGRQDAAEALALVQEWARTPEDEERVLAAFTFKCDVLWSLLDAVEHAARVGEAVDAR